MRVNDQAAVQWVRGYGGFPDDYLGAVIERTPGELYAGGNFAGFATYGPFSLYSGATFTWHGVLLRLEP